MIYSFSILKMLRAAVSYKPIKLGSTYTSVERLKVRVSFSRKTQIINNKIKKKLIIIY